jgi:hypothetical protein
VTLQVLRDGRPAEKVSRCPDCKQDFSGLDVEEFLRQCARSFD